MLDSGNVGQVLNLPHISRDYERSFITTRGEHRTTVQPITQAMIRSEATLFVIDDQLPARQGVAALACSIGVNCETFASAEEFLQRYDPSRAGCVLSDLRLTGISGLDLQQRLAAAGSTLPVILISAYADVPTAVRAMQNGALTVLEKPYRDDQLADTIRVAMEVNRRKREDHARRAEVQQRVDGLTDREHRLMQAVLAGRPNRLIARDLEISQRTVDRIRSAVFEKMGVDSAVELMLVVGGWQASDRAGHWALPASKRPPPEGLGGFRRPGGDRDCAITASLLQRQSPRKPPQG